MRLQTWVTSCWSMTAIICPLVAGYAKKKPVGDALRGSLGKNETVELEWERVHVIRRVYGPDNWAVRSEVARIEERMQRYQTGFNGDPNHQVPYLHHPYDKESRSRRLETNSTSKFQPMRIRFYTEALDDIRNATNAAQIDWFKSVILPKAANFWSTTLSVVPVSGALKISSAELDSYTYCGDPEFTAVPSSHKSDGIQDTDLILYVSGSPSPKFCPERTLAVAVPCNFDQYDRPTAGAVNVCLGNIVLNSDGTASSDVTNDYFDVSVHETGHVLGMSSNSYRFFWDPETGEPRTSRPFQAKSVTCVDGVQRTLVLPSTNTLTINQASNGRRYASIVTPRVRTVARNQFDCQTVEGGQLENQDTRTDACIGDHWDERQNYPEAMTAVISPTANIMSALTLALMEDSGWYKVNYTNAKTSPWGLGAGCDFVNEPCIVQGTNGPQLPDYSKGYFCTQAQAKGCSPELTHKMACTVIDYYYYVPQTLPESPYIYFPDDPTKGGPRQADYCPLYGSAYDNLEVSQLNCKNADNLASFNLYSEVYGSDSLCIPSTAGEGLCYRTACVKEEMALLINVLGVWIKCDYDFQTHKVRVGQGLLETTLICPRLSQACPDLFCPFNCAGRGVCNFANTVNGTVTPKCECFDTNDTSPGCSDSQIPNGDFLDNSNGLFNNVQQNFFDPLIAVFVDKPNVWSTASWAWAGGLIAVFLILLLCICSSFWPQRKRKYYS